MLPFFSAKTVFRDRTGIRRNELLTVASLAGGGDRVGFNALSLKCRHIFRP